MTESTRAIANLPGLDVELVHDKTEDGRAERVAIRLTGRPDLKTATKAIEPHLLTAAFAANPLFKLQADIARAMMMPLLAMNPMLKGLLPEPPKHKD